MKYGNCLLFLLTVNISLLHAQDPEYGRVYHFKSAYTSFPDSLRSKGYVYDSVFYPADVHYSDNAVRVFVPEGFKCEGTADLVFWFHGWRNQIDTAARFYELEKQFAASRRNALLIFPETAHNAPDSYGGKLEKEGDFLLLVNDILSQLKKKGVLKAKERTGKIILAGHSGAYRVIANILDKGKMPIDEVWLFDAMYGENDKYISWVQKDPDRRLVNWFTDHGGGTNEVSKAVMKQLQASGTSLVYKEEEALHLSDIKNNRILFIHSLREHNDIINRPDHFEWMMDATPYLRPVVSK